MMNPIKRFCAEVESSPALRFYGAALAGTHLVTWFFWSGIFRRFAGPGREVPVCWPFLPQCAEIREALSPAFLQAWHGLYLFAAVATVFSFLLMKSGRWGFWSLIALSSLKAGIQVLGYETMGNYHYMPWILSFIFLFLPGKKDLIRLMIIGFYLAAGMIKLNSEWLSGAAAPGLKLQGVWLWIGCAAATIFEFVIAPLLVAPVAWVRWFALATTAFFHAVSWHVVSYYYPVVMSLLLTIYPLIWLLEPDQRGRSIGTDLFRLALPKSTVIVLSIFTFFQFLPLFYSADPAVTGEGRMWSLNMYDARTDCVYSSFVRSGNTTIQDTRNLNYMWLRVRCDPLLYYHFAQWYCREGVKSGSPVELDMYLVGRRWSDRSFRNVINVQDFCSKNLKMNTWLPNQWINRF